MLNSQILQNEIHMRNTNGNSFIGNNRCNFSMRCHLMPLMKRTINKFSVYICYIFIFIFHYIYKNIICDSRFFYKNIYVYITYIHFIRYSYTISLYEKIFRFINNIIDICITTTFLSPKECYCIAYYYIECIYSFHICSNLTASEI